MLKDDRQRIDELKRNKYFNYAIIKRGVLIFIAITLLAFTALFFYSNTGASIKELRNVRFEFIGLILILVFFDWWIGGWRNTIFVRKVLPGASQRICFDANLANIFMGAVTPSQTGGGPMHLYMLYRRGVKLTHGIAISVINFISSILFFMISSGLALWYLRNTDINDTLYTLIKSGFTIFSTLFIFILVGLVAPQVISNLLEKFGHSLSNLSKKYKDKIEMIISNINAKLFEYNESVLIFLKKNPLLFPYSLCLTFIMYFNKFLIAYFIVKGLGYTGAFWEIISVQAITFFLLYFAPTPGASGIAELSIASLMAPFIPDVGIASFTVLHRSFLLLLPAVIGAFIVLAELKKHSVE